MPPRPVHISRHFGQKYGMRQLNLLSANTARSCSLIPAQYIPQGKEWLAVSDQPPMRIEVHRSLEPRRCPRQLLGVREPRRAAAIPQCRPDHERVGAHFARIEPDVAVRGR